MKNRYRQFRLFSVFIALLTALTLYYPKTGGIHAVVWIPKLISCALAPLLTLLNGINALVGFVCKDILLIGAGAVGAVIAARHVEQAITPDADFNSAFGANWEQQMPENISCHFTSHKWQPVVTKSYPGPHLRDLVYATNPDTGQPLLADILLPSRTTPPTGVAMIYVHGGAWLYGRKNISKLPCFRELATQGHLVMDIDYTKAPHISIPGMVKDVNRAILWLKQQAAVYNINPERIVLTGQSAGAHLALLTAYSPNNPLFMPPEMQGDTSVRAVISYYGPSDLSRLYYRTWQRFGSVSSGKLAAWLSTLLERTGYHGETLVEGIAGVIGGTPEETPDMYRTLSPISYVNPNCPPTLQFHGTHDIFVSSEEVEDLHLALQQAGVPSIHISFPGCDHAFDAVLPNVSPSTQTAAYYQERFIALMV